jgi:hypothetical protein
MPGDAANSAFVSLEKLDFERIFQVDHFDRELAAETINEIA